MNMEESKSGADREQNKGPLLRLPENPAKLQLPTADSGIQICINDVTVDSSEEADAEAIDLIKKQWRRSSWCPVEGRKKEEKHEKQKMILAVAGKSQSLSSLEGDDDDSEDGDDADANKSAPMPAALTHKNAAKCKKTTKSGERGSRSSDANQKEPSSNKHKKGRRFSHQIGNAGITKVPFNLTGNQDMQVGFLHRSPILGRMSSGAINAGIVLTNDNEWMNHPLFAYRGCVSASNDGAPMSESRINLQNTLFEIQKFIAQKDSCYMFQNTRMDGYYDAMEFHDPDTFSDRLIDKNKAKIIAADTISMASTGDEDDDESPKRDSKQQKVKHRNSVFSKIGSYRQKKASKEARKGGPAVSGGSGSGLAVGSNKTGTEHQFVPIAFSNSTTCDVCSKSMCNKPAVQCGNCLTNVHEISCKDQALTCPRSLHTALNTDESSRDKLNNSSGGATASPKAQPASKDKRPISVPTRSTAQASNSRSSSPNSVKHSVVNAGYFQWRRVASKLGIDRVISEDNSKDSIGIDETTSPVPACPPNSLLIEIPNFSENLSTSIESLDDGSTDLAEFDDDPDLMINEDEPEAWSVTVDKKTLKKMTAKNIKKQDHIWEFVQTEKRYYRVLLVISKVFVGGMLRDINLSQEMVDRLFPKLDDLIDIHLKFLQSLVAAQRKSTDKSIEGIGQLLYSQFDGKMTERMKMAYGEFCSRHNEALQLYKDLLKSDVAFQEFIKKCSRNSFCKRMGIAECILAVAQRLTKYPLLMGPIIKTTPDNSSEKKLLTQCLTITHDILTHVNDQVDARVKEQRLFEIYNKLDARSTAVLNGKSFKKSDLLSNTRKLIYEGHLKWMSARGKPSEVLAIVLSDVIFFLSETNQKMTFFSQDNKSSVISIGKLLVREKGDTKDSKGMYLICQSRTEPEMYEFICKTAEARRTWIETIRAAIGNCPEDGEPSEFEAGRKLQEAAGARLRQLIDQLHQKDQAIVIQCHEKMVVVMEILEIFAKDDISNHIKQMNKEQEVGKLFLIETIFLLLLNEVTRLLSLMKPPASCSPSVNQNLNNLADDRAAISADTDTRNPMESVNESDSEPQIVESRVSDLEADGRDGGQDTEKIPTVGILEEATETAADPAENQLLSAEQCILVAKILQHVHDIVCISSQHTTELQSLSGQLDEANSKISRLKFENDRLSHERRSPSYQPDKQLEELRSLQGSIQQQRINLDQLKEEQNASVNQQRKELMHLQNTVDKQKAELKCQKEDLHRQRELLQEQIEMFEEHKSKLMKTFPAKTGSSETFIWPGENLTPENNTRSSKHRQNCQTNNNNLDSPQKNLVESVSRGSRGNSKVSDSSFPSSSPIKTVPRMQSLTASNSGNLSPVDKTPRRASYILPIQFHEDFIFPEEEVQASMEHPTSHQPIPLKLPSPSKSGAETTTRHQSLAQTPTPPSSTSGSPSSVLGHSSPEEPASSSPCGSTCTRSASFSKPSSSRSVFSFRKPSPESHHNPICRAIAAGFGSLSSFYSPSSSHRSQQQPKPRLVSTMSTGNMFPWKFSDNHRHGRNKNEPASANQSPVTVKRPGGIFQTSPGREDCPRAVCGTPTIKKKEILYF